MTHITAVASGGTVVGHPQGLLLPETSSALVGTVLRVSRNLAAVARAHALTQLPSARHDDRSRCCH